ncbi:hypothetical protein C3F09_04090 [candidate division GN15 bacterium]|uniref:non-specific serine/threonine protein kinase n=1 Tax=candidate division GN15 bacterium TaxID=2072418 RepID=A0A855XA63_9BACT|nr:MAG: hypothetical protein C3F09_04090 [candidate division GN15 bacterium]
MVDTSPSSSDDRTQTYLPLVVGTMVSHYRIIEKIGAGGMGEVYLAEDTELNRKVALKFLPPHLCQDADCRARFKREAQAAAKLDHPNIVSVFEVGEFQGRPFFSMQHVEGQSLKEVIAGRTLLLERIINLGIQICDGLQAAHEKGITHRDIKPSNILIDSHGRARIVDFGLASVMGLDHLTKTGSTMGTVAYMSPEQARGLEVDFRADIWSFGVVLYEMFTGRIPFPGDHDQAIIYSILHDDPQRLKNPGDEVTPELQNIIDAALRKDVASRFQSAAEISKRLKVILQHLSDRSLEPGRRVPVPQWLRRPVISVPVLIAVAAASMWAAWYVNREAEIRQAREDLLPQIVELVDAGRDRYIDAYNLAVKAKQYLPKDTLLDRLFRRVSVSPSISTEPTGASVYIREYRKPESVWEPLGVTPVSSTIMPVGFYRWKLAKSGYDTVIFASPTVTGPYADAEGYKPVEINRLLDRSGTVPRGMIRVSGGTIRGIGRVGDFFIDRYEVTNKQFKDFVDSGGYRREEFWRQEIVKDGEALTFAEASRDFVDQTGRPGPAGWQGGDYPDGKGDYPVSGVSWYEAAAYAAFTGKSLPSMYHWEMASSARGSFMTRGFFTLIAPMSNFRREGPMPVGSNPGMTYSGAYDMAGNVREWCWNASPGGRIIRGGAWNDAPYMFGNYSQASPFDRSETNGVRCVAYVDSASIPAAVFGPYETDDRSSPWTAQPVSDEVFSIFKEQFSYDRSALTARVESVNNSLRECVQEKVSFAAAYEHERVIGYLFLPTNSAPPYQTVIYFPGSGVVYSASSRNLTEDSEFLDRLLFIIKSGRAVFWPVYKGTFERQDSVLVNADDSSHLSSEWTVKIVKDLRRSIDYLGTRSDIDTSRLAYLGYSWGGVMGAIIPAVEKRLKAVVLAVGGIHGTGRPEVRDVNYVSRVTTPVLMLNGKYDLTLPYETSSKPMFDLLGTPANDKLMRLYETDHFIPRNEFIRETLAWLDRYLGPVRLQ